MRLARRAARYRAVRRRDRDGHRRGGRRAPRPAARADPGPAAAPRPRPQRHLLRALRDGAGSRAAGGCRPGVRAVLHRGDRIGWPRADRLRGAGRQGRARRRSAGRRRHGARHRSAGPSIAPAARGQRPGLSKNKREFSLCLRLYGQVTKQNQVNLSSRSNVKGVLEVLFEGTTGCEEPASAPVPALCCSQECPHPRRPRTGRR
ncbi:protein of unknown function [Methylorubrum extorquens]|uniref:Uncharacterized protein n=1 Tax=Methylorubrum extorquens TaxID=408 RepID=A0A2N9ASN1_METEX|nr:protein of unknown function [Methylorubrum extorquens]